MKKLNLVKNITEVLIISIFLFFLFTFKFSALETRENWNSNESLFSSNGSFGKVDSAYLIQANPTKPIKDCVSWLREIQYYFSSRFSLKDVPFHYFLCQDKLYQVAKDGPENKFNIENSNKAILVLVADDSLNVNADLVSILNKYGISQTNIFSKDLKILLNDTDKSVKFLLVDSSKKYSFADNLKTQLTGNIQYLVAIEEMNGQTNLNSGDTATITLKLKNTGDVGIYAGGATIFAITDNPFDKKSQFYLDENTWASFSRANLLATSDKILSQEEKVVNLKVKFVPNTSQDFVIGNFYGNKIQSTEFTITTTQNEVKAIKRQTIATSSSASTTSQTVTTKQIKIVSSLGYVNIRSTASTGANILGKVYTGQIYKVLDSTTGWYKIQSGSVVGWINSGYVTLLN